MSAGSVLESERVLDDHPRLERTNLEIRKKPDSYP